MTQGFSGVGLISSHNRTTSGGKGNGTFWGNCPKYDIAFNPSSVERNSSMDTARSPLRKMTQATQAAVTLVTDEFNKANFARGTQGRVDQITADAATTYNTTFETGAIAGTVLAVADLNVNAVVVTDSTGSPKTLTADVNYTLDGFSGHITLLDLTTGGPFVQPFKAQHKKGAVTVIAGLAIPIVDIWVAFAGTNADNGQRCANDTYRVRLDPMKQFSYINSDYTDQELGGSALIDTTKLASAVGGQVFRLGLPATHE